MFTVPLCSWKAANFRQLEPLFKENFENFGDFGAAVSVWQNGKPVVDLYGGFCDARRENSWEADTLVLVWSATKGIGGASFCMYCRNTGSKSTDPWWSSGLSSQAGKEKITLSQFFRIKPDFALWMRELIYSITAPLSGHSNTKAIVAPGDCTWVSRPHVWILARRTRASDRRENTVAVLERSVCAAAQSRSLDRLARRRECTCSHGLRRKKRQAAGADLGFNFTLIL